MDANCFLYGGPRTIAGMNRGQGDCHLISSTRSYLLNPTRLISILDFQCITKHTSSKLMETNTTKPAPAQAPPRNEPPPPTEESTTCRECRRRKVKCDGVMPVCTICRKYRRHCLYDKHSRTRLTRRYTTYAPCRSTARFHSALATDTDTHT